MPQKPETTPSRQPSGRPGPAVATPRTPQGSGRGGHQWGRSFFEFALAVTVLALVQAVAVKAYQIPSSSMESTLMTGDRIVVNRLDDTVQRGDIVVFEHGDTWTSTRRSPSESATVNVIRAIGTVVGLGPSTRAYTVKRIIAAGGETVACCDDAGRVTVDGVPLTEDYLGSDLPFEPGTSDCASTPPSARCFPEVTVPGGSLFLLGDNRANSADSAVSCRGRTEAAGCARFVRRDQVVGPVVARIWPLTTAGRIDP